MRRWMSVTWIAALLALTAAPAMAEEQDEMPPDQGGATEPAPAYYVDISVSEVEGSDTGQVPVGEATRVTLRATNTSADPAKGVTLTIEPSANVTISPTSLSFGDLAGDGGAADRVVTVEVAEQGCQDFVGWGATLSSSLGEQATKFGVSVLCPGPRLMQEQVEYVGGDGDNIPEPGETLEVYVTYANHGRDAATHVTATARTSSEGITLKDATASWGTIAAGGRARATEPFVIAIAPDAKAQETGCSWDGGGMVVEDGDQTVSSDGSTTTPDEPQPSGEGGGTGGSSGAATTTAEAPAEETAVREDGARQEPAQDDPQEAPEPRRAEQPAADPAVIVTAEMTVTAEEVTFEDTFSNQMYCTMMESQRGGPAAGAPTEDDGAERTAKGARDLLAGSAGESDEGRDQTVLLAAILLAAVGSQVGWRLLHAKMARASAGRE